MTVKEAIVPLPPAPERECFVVQVDCHRSIVREVDAAVDASPKRVQALRQAVLAPAFSAAA